jgi:hypothetical protein
MTEPTSPSRTTAPAATARGGWQAAVRGLARTLLRGVVFVLGFVLMLAAVFAGLVLAVVLVLWGLLRGRRPTARVFKSAFERGRRRGHVAPGQVIDVEVREVPEPVLPRRDT